MKRIWLCLGVLVLLASAVILYRADSVVPIKRLVGLSMDKIGITRNTYDIRVDDELRPFIYIYWLGENGTKDDDRMLLYHRTFCQDIPDCYGRNQLVVKAKTDSTLYSKMGYLKLYAFSKHNYYIDLKLKDTLLIVDWSIDNWYSEKISITDTLAFKIERN